MAPIFRMTLNPNTQQAVSFCREVPRRGSRLLLMLPAGIVAGSLSLDSHVDEQISKSPNLPVAGQQVRSWIGWVCFGILMFKKFQEWCE